MARDIFYSTGISFNSPKQAHPMTDTQDQIWTDEQNDIRELDNMLSPKGKYCKNCQWGTAEKGMEFTTCGHHLQNFSVNSFCAYWTDPQDKYLLAYFGRRKAEIRKKLDNKSSSK